MDPIGFTPFGGFPPPAAPASNTATTSREDEKIAALYSGENPVYQEPDAPGVVGTAVEFEIRNQLLTLCEKARTFLLRYPNISPLSPDFLDASDTLFVRQYISAWERNAIPLLDVFMDRMRDRDTPADAVARFYNASFKRTLESLIAQCEDATAEDIPGLKSALILVADRLNEPEASTTHEDHRRTNLDHARTAHTTSYPCSDRAREPSRAYDSNPRTASSPLHENSPGIEPSLPSDNNSNRPRKRPWPDTDSPRRFDWSAGKIHRENSSE